MTHPLAILALTRTGINYITSDTSVPLLFSLYVESLLCEPKFSVLSDTDCIHSVASADPDR